MRPGPLLIYGKPALTELCLSSPNLLPRRRKALPTFNVQIRMESNFGRAGIHPRRKQIRLSPFTSCAASPAQCWPCEVDPSIQKAKKSLIATVAISKFTSTHCKHAPCLILNRNKNATFEIAPLPAAFRAHSFLRATLLLRRPLRDLPGVFSRQLDGPPHVPARHRPVGAPARAEFSQLP